MLQRNALFSFVSHADFEFGFHVSRHGFSLLSNTKWTPTKQSQLGQLVFSWRSIATFGCCLVVLVLQEALPRGPHRAGLWKGIMWLWRLHYLLLVQIRKLLLHVFWEIPVAGVRKREQTGFGLWDVWNHLYLLRCSLLLTPVSMKGGVTCLPTCPLNIDLLM